MSRLTKKLIKIKNFYFTPVTIRAAYFSSESKPLMNETKSSINSTVKNSLDKSSLNINYYLWMTPDAENINKMAPEIIEKADEIIFYPKLNNFFKICLVTFNNINIHLFINKILPVLPKLTLGKQGIKTIENILDVLAQRELRPLLNIVAKKLIEEYNVVLQKVTIGKNKNLAYHSQLFLLLSIYLFKY